MSDAPDPKRLAELEERIAAAKGTQKPKPKGDDHYSGAQHAWRMVVELVVGIAIGTGIGYWLDVLFDTSPWFLLPFTLLGFAAGINVMLKTARELNETNPVPGTDKDNEGN